MISLSFIFTLCIFFLFLENPVFVPIEIGMNNTARDLLKLPKYENRKDWCSEIISPHCFSCCERDSALI